MSSHYFYILTCADDTLYCGYTTNLERRINAHNTGKGAKYTRSRLPVKLSYFEKFDSKHQAMKREWQVKKYTRKQKLELIQKHEKR